MASDLILKHMNSNYGYWQLKDWEPDDPTVELHDAEQVHLAQPEGAAWLDRCVSDGFTGVAAFSCPVGDKQKPSVLYVEVVDAGNGGRISLTSAISYTRFSGKMSFGSAEMDVIETAS